MIDWDSLAKAAGLNSGKELLQRSYSEERNSISGMASKYGCGTNTIRAALQRYGIEVRGRGGVNFQKVVLTEEFLAELRRDGVLAVANAYEVDASAIYKALRRENIQLRPTDVTRSAEEAPPTEGEPHED
jgi:hypothetical protein